MSEGAQVSICYVVSGYGVNELLRCLVLSPLAQGQITEVLKEETESHRNCDARKDGEMDSGLKN